MTLKERIAYLTEVFIDLQETSSTIIKQNIVASIHPDVKEDFEYIVKCLTGEIKFGYKYYDTGNYNCWPFQTVKEALNYLQAPQKQGDLSTVNIHRYISGTSLYADFFEPIVNRTLKLGIGKSILPKSALAPMLAKKFEYLEPGQIFVTEKLDGNRCIAHCDYDTGKWNFVSRNGKPMNVEFDMTGLNTNYIYDGEVMSRVQTDNSIARTKILLHGDKATITDESFNDTSGLINRHDPNNKNLVYNIFDIIDDDMLYWDRRAELDKLAPISDDVRILPVLLSTPNLSPEIIHTILDQITSLKGEGLMLNYGFRKYEHKRTNALLKVKKTYTMDMRVLSIEEGDGKYLGTVGALIVATKDDDGNFYMCKVGSGLSDTQRYIWFVRPEKIIGKIVEVAYFSTSQDAATKGTNNYSLRFPRLKNVRYDKKETSVD